MRCIMLSWLSTHGGYCLVLSEKVIFLLGKLHSWNVCGQGGKEVFNTYTGGEGREGVRGGILSAISTVTI